MDDVRERAERFTALENFRHIVAGLRGDKHEKRDHNSNYNNNRELHPGRSLNDQDRKNRAMGPDIERNHRDDVKNQVLRTFAQFTPLNTPRSQIFHLY